VLFEQFAQHPGVEHAIAAGALKPIGSNRATRIAAINRTP
jgi:hypothetical protein